MLSHPSTWLLVAYVLIFIYCAYRDGQFQWLWGSVFVWLGLGALGARLLPGILGIAQFATFYTPHLYIAIGSLFFFVNHWQKLPGLSMWYARSTSMFIGLFAVSGALMLTALTLLTGIIWLGAPGTLRAYLLPILMQMYLLEPLFWIGLQTLLMALFFVHRVFIEKRSANVFSNAQLQVGLLLALLVQTAWIVSSLWGLRH